ncbi:MAG: hypothetical protein ABI778_05845 [Ignavibacteriota bacterium]
MKKIEIIDQIPATVPQFTFDNGTQLLDVDSQYLNGTQQKFSIHFQPSVSGLITAVIRATWDSAGVLTFHTLNDLVGNGSIEEAILSSAQSLYSARTGDTIEMNLNLLGGLNSDAKIMGVSFLVTYSPAILQLTDSSWKYAPSLFEKAKPQISTDINQNTQIVFNLASTAPLQALDNIIRFPFKVIAYTDTSAMVSLSNFTCWTQSIADTLCYVKTSTVSPSIRITKWEDSSSSHDLDNVRIIAEPNKQLAAILNNTTLHRYTIDCISLIGTTIDSWSGIVSGYFKKLFYLPMSGFYVIRLQIDSRQYFFPRIIY